MAKKRVFLRRRQTIGLVDHQEGPRTVHVWREPAWADAWPHLDDWFKTEERLSRRDGTGPVIV
ncbi:MAG: hypothetical protein HYZ91_02245 [Candidatus Omnitrophica bacterium]|nr:hypothetical protein [Candidatus Omnitrophota bacterium]